MADNITVPPTGGAGTANPVVATDDVGPGVHFQIVKLDGGGNGLTVPIVAGQQTKAGSLPVTLASDQGVLPVSDNAASLTVDAPVTTPVFVSLSDGAAALKGQKTMANSVPVVLASDETALPITDNAGSLTVDAPVGTPVFARLSDGAATLIGQKAMATSLPVVLASDQTTIPVGPATVLYRGRANTFRTPGRAGTTGQKILSIHNATGSAITAVVTKLFVDHTQTVIIAVTVLPPSIRAWKVTVLPTNGTALTKVKTGGSTTANASVTVLGDASADGTGSASALTATLPAGTIIAQEFASRLITAAGYEMCDRVEFDFPYEIVLAPLEGIVLFLDYVLATQNPTTDMWTAGVEWYEK